MSKQPEEGLIFEALKIGGDIRAVLTLQRTRVPGGWLLAACHLAMMSLHTASVTFYPDPEHKWDGKSLPAGNAEAKVEEK